MTANVASFHQNYPPDRKNNDNVEKDIRKWVESVVEFKANMDKKKSEQPLEKHLKKVKKYKIKKKTSLVAVPLPGGKNILQGQRKNLKAKKGVKKSPVPQMAEKSVKKTNSPSADPFDAIKDSYRSLKLPQNWTSGLSNNRLVFNRIKVTTQNAQQKMTVERSLVITKDRTVHVLVNGSEITLNNWEMQKVDTIDDIKRAIKDFDSLKICDGQQLGIKSPQCSLLIDSKLKLCQACKSETVNSQKPPVKKTKKKASGSKGIPKENSPQNNKPVPLLS